MAARVRPLPHVGPTIYNLGQRRLRAGHGVYVRVKGLTCSLSGRGGELSLSGGRVVVSLQISLVSPAWLWKLVLVPCVRVPLELMPVTQWKEAHGERGETLGAVRA